MRKPSDTRKKPWAPVENADRKEQLRRLVSVLRIDLAIVYDCSHGEEQQVKALLEQISTDLRVPLRILVDEGAVTFFVPEESACFQRDFATTWWFETTGVAVAEAVHGLPKAERARFGEFMRLVSKERGVYECGPQEDPERIKDLLERAASTLEEVGPLETTIKGRRVVFKCGPLQEVRFADEAEEEL